MVLSEKFVRRAIIEWLSRKGYGRNLREKATDEHGADIKVRHNNYARYFIVEAKGDAPSHVKSPRSRREVSFVLALGQIVTRMNPDAGYRYGIGFPEVYRDKVVKRLPWQFCRRNNLCALFVSSQGKVSCLTWRDLKKRRVSLNG